jgi:hypothetical protein
MAKIKIKELAREKYYESPSRNSGNNTRGNDEIIKHLNITY